MTFTWRQVKVIRVLFKLFHRLLLVFATRQSNSFVCGPGGQKQEQKEIDHVSIESQPWADYQISQSPRPPPPNPSVEKSPFQVVAN